MLDPMSWRARLGFLPDGPATDEAALLGRIAAGDAKALALLYRRESGSVYRFALALSGDEAAALDAMQEAFTQLLRGPTGFDPARGSLGAYLAGMARHHLLATWRERDRYAADPAEPPEPAVPGAEALLVRAEARAGLWDAVRRLPWSQREALVLVDLQERPYAEAAAIAGVSLDVLRTRLHRARQRLADLLQGELK
jgi:RNA polymerase sigma-70 factor (ECF subfamily)